ncbi:VgrG protein [Photobacterium marinum]|uniref:VgrG protein n=1 Tax=Photobacterium marinum TaxID=1056511 RepID=L8J8R0_9GAMM|nr:type VI secretion system tip protein TssI/VgrG [Photobacterium marinum]ELR64593.1 VgrG protein [Photobacterium marinum]
MEKATQDKNIISITTPLGKDVLYLTKFELQEGVSSLFSIQAFVYANNELVDVKSIVGKSVTIKIVYNLDGMLSERFINGIVSSARSTGSRATVVADGEKYQDYILKIEPNLSLLSGRTNCRIFQAVNFENIVKTIFAEHDVKVQSELQKNYPIYDYKVQYHESDLDFVNRLLEEEGVFFFFHHDESDHYVVLADDITAYKECPEATVTYTTGSYSEAHIHSWSAGVAVVPGSSVRRGYDFIKPGEIPSGKHAKTELISPQSGMEVYEYQAESEFNRRAQSSANIALESLQKDVELSSGGSNCRSFSAGQYFTFKGHEDSRFKNKSYVLTHVNLQISVSNQVGPQKSPYQFIQNQFSCVPKETVYRPAQLTPKPRIYGAQTAVVTGNDGDEIYVDKYGRVKVLFHWDREGVPDSTSSCWIRVAQNWAGNRWGAFFFPRVGQEVLVEFLDGDPDQPIISGALYNGDLMPPYDLPGNKTQSGIKTCSTKEGGVDNYNEIRFEDEKDNELLYFHAEKDHHLIIENDFYSFVENNSNQVVKNDSQVSIENDLQKTVKNDYKLQVDNNINEKIGKQLIIDAGNKIVIKSGGASITLSSGGSIDIKGSSIKVNGSDISLKAGTIAVN